MIISYIRQYEDFHFIVLVLYIAKLLVYVMVMVYVQWNVKMLTVSAKNNLTSLCTYTT